MVLAAHSMGAYLSVRYAQSFAARVHAMVLLSPVGVPEAPPPGALKAPLPWWMKLARALWDKGWGPFDAARAIPGRVVSDRYVNAPPLSIVCAFIAHVLS